MSPMRDEIDKYLKRYQGAEPVTQIAMREETLYQFNKWKVIKEELRKIVTGVV